jgi:ribonuclease-3
VVTAALSTLAQRVGLDEDSATLEIALTHSSYAAEHDVASNERLEFLGDAVVDLAVADYVVSTFAHLSEGDASILRARVVNESALAAAAREIDLSSFIRVGRGVLKENGLERDSLLADAFEALTAALYLDRGFAEAKAFVLALLEPAILEAANAETTLDPKTRLRQWCETSGLAVPQYAVHAHGPSHDVTFVATVRVASVEATGEGRSKKRAETAAAQAAWEELNAGITRS